MRHLRRPLAGWLLVSSPLLISFLSACDSQSPSFVENSTLLPEGGVGTPYNGSDSQDGSAGAGSAAGTDGGDIGTAYDPLKDDETPADKGEPTGGPSVAVAKWSFKASSLEQGSVSLDAGFGEIEQRIQMSNNRVDNQLRFEQVNRPVATETFAQGSEQAAKSESFQQTATATGTLDILLVVDNSGSMAEEQVNLSSKMAPLLSYVENADWKIGVVTTDPDNGCLRGLISKGEAQANQKFAQAVNAGVQGSGNERGILQAVNGLKGECNAEGSWLRRNSTLAVLIISDEDNCSNGQGCGTEPWASSNYLIDYMASIRQVGINARVYGLGWDPNRAQSTCRTAAYKASTYYNAVTRSGGTWGSVCDSDYSNTLRAVSLDLSIILKTQFTLQGSPNAGSVKVYVNDQLQTSGYQLRGNLIEFAQAPAAGAQIRIDYAITTVPLKKEFVLSSAAGAGTVQVYLDGVATQAFSYQSASKTIAFNTAPTAHEIKAVYRKDIALERSFALTGQVLANSISVKVAGQAVANTAWTFDAASGKVTLNAAPSDAQVIDVLYTEEVAPKLRYGINFPEAMRNRLIVVDANTNRPLSFTVSGRELVFPLSEYRATRDVSVRYPVGEGAWVIDLGYPIVIDSVKVAGTRSGSCRAVRVQGTEVDLSGCTFAQDEGISIDFDYAGEHSTSFDLGTLDVDLARYTWKVLVNGQAASGFSITDNKIEFAELPYYADVEITLYKK